MALRKATAKVGTSVFDWNSVSPKGSSTERNGHLQQRTENDERFSLKRTWGIWAGISLNIGIMIGSGIFISPKGVLNYSGSIGMSLIVWASAGLLFVCGGLCYSELSTMIGKSSGPFIYLKSAYGSGMAFMDSFIGVFVRGPALEAIIAMTCSNYMLSLFFDDDCGGPPTIVMKLLAIVLVVFVGALNMASSILGKNVQILFTATKLLGVIFIIIGGLVMLAKGHTQNFEHAFQGTTSSATNIVLAYYTVSFSYSGWDGASQIVEEVKRPNRNVPLSVIVSVLTVTIIYVLTNISYYAVMSKDELLASDAVGITWAEKVTPGLAWIISVIVVLSTFGSLNGSILGSARSIYRIAREGQLPSVFGMVHATRFTPLSALFLKALFVVIYIIPSDIQFLFNMTGFTGWTIQFFVYIGLIVMRFTKKDTFRPFKVPIIIPALMSLVSAFFIIVPFIQTPRFEYVYGITMLFGSLLFYFPFVYFKWSLPGVDSATLVTQLLFQLAPSEINQ